MEYIESIAHKVLKGRKEGTYLFPKSSESPAERALMRKYPQYVGRSYNFQAEGYEPTFHLNDFFKRRRFAYTDFSNLVHDMNTSGTLAEKFAKSVSIPIEELFPKDIYPWLHIKTYALRKAISEIRQRCKDVSLVSAHRDPVIVEGEGSTTKKPAQLSAFETEVWDRSLVDEESTDRTHRLPLEHQIASDTPGPSDVAEQTELLQKAIRNITEEDRKILTLRYNLDGGGERKIKEIARQCELSLSVTVENLRSAEIFLRNAVNRLMV